MQDTKFVAVNTWDEKKTVTIDENRNVLLREWLPEEDHSHKQLKVTSPDYTYTEKTSLKECCKESIDFEYVFCIGGDGTLLCLLRTLFFRFLPPTLPKIVTFSMGSLGYLCNF